MITKSNDSLFQGERLTNVVPCTIAQIHQMAESDENLKVGSLSAKIVSFFFVSFLCFKTFIVMSI